MPPVTIYRVTWRVLSAETTDQAKARKLVELWGERFPNAEAATIEVLDPMMVAHRAAIAATEDPETRAIMEVLDEAMAEGWIIYYPEMNAYERIGKAPAVGASAAN